MVEKRTIFLELPCEMIEKIDIWNTMGDRSLFVSELLEKQMQQEFSKMDLSNDLTTRMGESKAPLCASGEINLVNSRGLSLGKFDIDTVDGFEHLAQKISELSNDPIVRMRARRWR